MSAKIIDMFERRPAPVAGELQQQGNGAREALIEVAKDLPSTSDEDSAKWSDWILASLWAHGFKVVPLGTHDVA